MRVPDNLHCHHADGEDRYLGEGEDVVLVQMKARALQVQTELLPLERVDVPGCRVTVAVDDAALTLATETEAGTLQQYLPLSHTVFLKENSNKN